jgi:hypothetical protein
LHSRDTAYCTHRSKNSHRTGPETNLSAPVPRAQGEAVQTAAASALARFRGRRNPPSVLAPPRGVCMDIHRSARNNNAACFPNVMDRARTWRVVIIMSAPIWKAGLELPCVARRTDVDLRPVLITSSQLISPTRRETMTRENWWQSSWVSTVCTALRIVTRLGHWPYS